jgi:tryptophan-rich sensory protein
MNKNNLIKLFASIIICELAGVVGSIFTAPAVGTWFKTLVKPVFAPPNWVFGPVWSMLFFLMGISLYLVWNKKGNKEQALQFFAIQLFLNIAWSFLFFGLRSPYLAFIGIIFLWIAILFTIIKFYKINKISAYLLVPYILWVSFAAILNCSLWILNG